MLVSGLALCAPVSPVPRPAAQAKRAIAQPVEAADLGQPPGGALEVKVVVVLAVAREGRGRRCRRGRPCVCEVGNGQAALEEVIPLLGGDPA